MESEGQPVASPSSAAPAPHVSALAADTFRKLEDQAASERGDKTPADALA